MSIKEINRKKSLPLSIMPKKHYWKKKKFIISLPGEYTRENASILKRGETALGFKTKINLADKELWKVFMCSAGDIKSMKYEHMYLCTTHALCCLCLTSVLWLFKIISNSQIANDLHQSV